MLHNRETQGHNFKIFKNIKQRAEHQQDRCSLKEWSTHGMYCMLSMHQWFKHQSFQSKTLAISRMGMGNLNGSINPKWRCKCIHPPLKWERCSPYSFRHFSNNQQKMLDLLSAYLRQSTWHQIVTHTLLYKSTVVQSTMWQTSSTWDPWWHLALVTWRDARHWLGLLSGSWKNCGGVLLYQSWLIKWGCSNQLVSLCCSMVASPGLSPPICKTK